MKPFFENECQKMIEKIQMVRQPGDLCFALMSGTFLSDYADDTDANIRAVDAAVSFDGVIHLGDILRGNIPEKASRFVLSKELERFQKCTSAEKLYVVCGDCDGFRDETYVGQIVSGIVTEERWCAETRYLEDYESISRPKLKPYYYADYVDQKCRLIFLSSYQPQIDEDARLFEKSCQLGVEQLAWLKKSALDVPSGWTVFLFSHAIPKSRFETGKDPWSYMGYSSEPSMMLLRLAQERGIRLGGWFAGHYACDYEASICGIPYFLIDSVHAMPSKSAFAEVRKASERCMDSETQDLWDVLLLKPEQQTVQLLRFGVGEDRTVRIVAK